MRKLSFLSAAVVGVCSVLGSTPVRANFDELMPLVRQETMIIARLDVEGSDAKALTAYAKEVIGRAKIDEKTKTKMLADMDKDTAEFVAGAEKAKAAGLQTMYVVVPAPSLGGPPAEGGNQPVFVLKIKDGGDPAAVREALKMGDEIKSDTIGGLSVYGPESELNYLKGTEAEEIPEITEAAKVVKAEANYAVLVPPPAILMMVPAMAPQLPPELGGGPTADLVTGLKFIVLSGSMPPKHTGAMSVYTSQPEKFGAAVNKIRDTVSKRDLTNANEEERVAMEVLNSMPALEIAKDHVGMKMDSAQIDKIADQLVPAAVRSRAAAERAMAASNQRQLVVGVIMHANEKAGAMPASLDEIKGNMNVDDATWTQLTTGANGKPLIYIQAAAKMDDIKKPDQTVILHEALEGREKTDVAVFGFADGHVETLTIEEFEKRVAAGEIIVGKAIGNM
jgi:hypothetical protein